MNSLSLPEIVVDTVYSDGTHEQVEKRVAQIITFHWARRGAANWFYHKTKDPILTMQLITGHTSVQSLMKYLRVEISESDIESVYDW